MSDERDRQPGPRSWSCRPAAGTAAALGRSGVRLPARRATRATLDLPPGSAARAARAGDGRQIVCDNLVRIYKVADLEVVALQGLDLLVEPAR